MAALQQAELLADKLTLLGANREWKKRRPDMKPLHSLYFVKPIPGRQQEQFQAFVTMTQWLIDTLSRSNVSNINEYEDPQTVVQNIMNAAKKYGFVADFPATKLRTGAGEQVVQILNALTERLLEQQRSTFKPPKHPDDVIIETPEVGDEEDEETDLEDITEDVPDFEDNAEPVFDNNVGVSVEDEEQRYNTMMQNKIDPAEWKLELERIGPRLKLSANPAQLEWGSDVELSLKHEHDINDQFPKAKSALEKLHVNLEKSADKIQLRERQLNKTYGHLCGEFGTKQSQCDQKQERQNQLNESIAQSTARLHQLLDKIDELQRQMEDKNRSLSDKRSLERLSKSLVQTKHDVSGMELRIGVLQETLLQLKASDIQHQYHVVGTLQLDEFE